MTDADVERVAPMLARAFADDPLFVWIEPDGERRAAFLTGFMRALAWRSHLFAEALTTAGEIFGASLWKGPELGRLSPEQLARSGLDRVHELLGEAAAERFERGMGHVEALLERDLREPHWYLGVLAVEPAHQGRGLGGRLMRPILERAAAEGVAVTLETTRAGNVAFYQRYGFEVLHHGDLPGGGPPFWTMRRAPVHSPGP